MSPFWLANMYQLLLEFLLSLSEISSGCKTTNRPWAFTIAPSHIQLSLPRNPFSPRKLLLILKNYSSLKGLFWLSVWLCTDTRLTWSPGFLQGSSWHTEMYLFPYLALPQAGFSLRIMLSDALTANNRNLMQTDLSNKRIYCLSKC